MLVFIALQTKRYIKVSPLLRAEAEFVVKTVLKVLRDTLCLPYANLSSAAVVAYWKDRKQKSPEMFDGQLYFLIFGASTLFYVTQLVTKKILTLKTTQAIQISAKKMTIMLQPRI